jgi:hypothetical protein
MNPFESFNAGNSIPEKGNSEKKENNTPGPIISETQNPDKPEDDSAPEVSDMREEKEIRIPRKIHQQLMVRISKFMADNAGNPNLDTAAAEKIMSGSGIKQDSPYFERLMREANLLLGIKTRDTRDRNRRIEKVRKEVDEEIREARKIKTGIRNVPVETVDERRNLQSDNVRRNENDIRWIDEVKDYIKEMSDKPDRIATFWESFEYIYKNRKTSDGTQIDTADLKRTKNGILSELAAEDLFLGWKEYTESEKKSGRENKNNLDKIEFTISKATPEEDARKKTDFFVSFDYNGEEVRLPVQVKSDYSEKDWNKSKDFSEKNICSFYGSFKPQEGNSLDEKRSKFFKENKLGFFVILPHGYNGLEILPNGKPSKNLQDLFYQKIREMLPALLTKLDNIKLYEAKQQRQGSSD